MFQCAKTVDKGRTTMDGKKTELVLEYGHSLHTAISAARLRGNLVSFPISDILTFCDVLPGCVERAYAAFDF